MAVDEVEVRRVQTIEGALDAGADARRGVVEVCGSHAARLCDEEEGGAWRGVGDSRESGAEEEFGGAVVGGCVEGVEAEREGAGDDGGGGHGLGVGYVLVVESGGADDERGKDGGEGRSRGRVSGGCGVGHF